MRTWDKQRTSSSIFVLALLAVGCGGGGGGGGGGGIVGGGGGLGGAAAAESCMVCHNGSDKNDYLGAGIENPHPFPGASFLACSACHGGDGTADDELAAHVPPPPEFADDAALLADPTAYFNFLTHAGIDKLADYEVDGVTYSPLDYLQFVNPGDLRVVSEGRGCGACHGQHSQSVAASMLATEVGILSGAMYAIGAENAVPENQGRYEDTAGDYAFRAIVDKSFSPGGAPIGGVKRLIEHPVYSVFGADGADDIFENPAYDAAELADDVQANNQVVTGSPLANLYAEQIAFTCGDCHLGSKGANNRYGDFRSAGCSACHMPYSQDGRSGSLDPFVNKDEPANPDAIAAPERPHVRSHVIRGVARTLSNGVEVQGIDDFTCAGCHQGSNRTVMQYWGIRLDQNADLANGVQYPANPVAFENTANDPRLFDAAVGNNTFNGRNANQYIVFEDYDGDGRDDTPEDVHYEAGLGCVDCHGSSDLHGGDVAKPGVDLLSRMEQNVNVSCESCHGSVDAYAKVKTGKTYSGQTAKLAVDENGKVMRHVVREGPGEYYLYSRLTGAKHYLPQTRDVVADNGAVNPFTSEPVFNGKASFAMGRVDNNPNNGIGPVQTNDSPLGFCHSDNMDCASCHASWTNTCVGCHLKGAYDTGNNFSNITGERIVFKQANADFTYQTPVPFNLGVDPDNKITQFSANTKVFFQWQDRNGTFSDIFSFTDRNGAGNDPDANVPSLSHNAIMAHSIRGRVTNENEGPRYCVACHLTQDGMAKFGAEYEAFRTAMANNDYGSLDFDLLQQHIGQNPGNQLDSPLWVHMVAGLGSGVFLFNADGGPVNPLDNNANRVGANGVAPAANFDPADVVLDLDCIVDVSGLAKGSNNHMLRKSANSPELRDGSADPEMAGPLGASLIRMLTDPVQGRVLDSWIDADGQLRGDAGNIVP